MRSYNVETAGIRIYILCANDDIYMCRRNLSYIDSTTTITIPLRHFEVALSAVSGRNMGDS